MRYRDNRATQVVTIASGLNMPNGVALREGALYVAEVNRILRFDDVGDLSPDPLRAARGAAGVGGQGLADAEP